MSRTAQLMTFIFSSFIAIFLSLSTAFATSTTNEFSSTPNDLPKTVVVRVNEKTNQTEVLHSLEALPADASQAESLASAEFSKIESVDSELGELDRDSGTTSWFFCYYNSAPIYYWNYGFFTYAYYPTYYYSYRYSGYRYTYYGYFGSYGYTTRYRRWR